MNDNIDLLMTIHTLFIGYIDDGYYYLRFSILCMYNNIKYNYIYIYILYNNYISIIIFYYNIIYYYIIIIYIIYLYIQLKS